MLFTHSRTIITIMMSLLLLTPEQLLAKGKAKEFVDVSGYTQLRYERFTQKEDGGDSIRDYSVERARFKVAVSPTDLLKTVVQVDASGGEFALKDLYAAYDLGHKRELSIGQMKWPFGYDVTYSSSDREVPERSLVFRRLFPGQRDRGATIEGKLGKHVDWSIGVFDGSGISVTSDYDSNKDIVGHLIWNHGNAEFGLSSYNGKGIWDKKRRRILNERKDRYGSEFRYIGNRWTLKTEYVCGRGVDETKKKSDYSEWVSGYYAQISYSLDSKNMLVARHSSMSQDPNEPDLGRRSALDLGLLRWLNSQNRVRFFYQVNNESQNSVDNNGLTAEWMVVY